MKMIDEHGRVAILVSRGYGAGWSTWNSIPGMETHRELVQMVLDGRGGEITEEMVQRVLELEDGEYVCVLGADQLTVEWVPEGTHYIIEEYDGSESIQTRGDTPWSIA